MANKNVNGDVNVSFTEAASRQTLDSGESVKTLFGKVKKWLSDLKPVAFSGSYNDLTDKPIIPQIVGLRVDLRNQTFTRLGLAADIANYNFSELSIYGGRRRCNVANDGTITAYYGDANYKEDGSNGQVMVYQPKFYYKVKPIDMEPQSETSEGGVGQHLRCAEYYVSPYPYNGFKLHPAFINQNNEEVDYYLEGAYEASLYDVSAATYITDDSQVADFNSDRLSSIAGVKPISGLTQNLTRANTELLANNRGAGWHNTTIQIDSADQLLMMIEFGTMNIQAALGNGVTSVPDNGSYNCSALTGSTSALGNASGRASETVVTKGSESTTYTANGYVSVSWRGKENPYGNIWKFSQGLLVYGNGSMKGGVPFISDTMVYNEAPAVTQASSADEVELAGYSNVGYTLTNNGLTTQTYTSGYISAFGWGVDSYEEDYDFDWLFIPTEVKGNSALPVGDYHGVTANLNGYRMALLGASWNYGLMAGPFGLHVNAAPSYWSRTIDGRAVYVPVRHLIENKQGDDNKTSRIFI